MRRLVAAFLLAILTAGPALAETAAEAWDRGVRAYEKGNYATAVRAFERAVQQAPAEGLYHLWLGLACFRTGRLDQAREHLETAARLGGDTEVGRSAKRNLAALDQVPVPSATPSPSSRSDFQGPTGWRRLGSVQGLLGEDWQVRDTRTCRVYARQGDLAYLEEVVGTLDAAFQANAAFMGSPAARVPLEFYFFPLSDPAHTHPRFASRVGPRVAGQALGGTLCVVNLGDWRTSRHYAPWDVAETACHEMNHQFLFQLDVGSRTGDWLWFAEALAEAVEDRVLPASRQQTPATMKSAMAGYASADANWRSLVADRNNQDLETYRAYGTLLASIVYFLQGKYGADAIPRLLKAARGRSLDDAFVEVFGRDTEGLQEEWKAWYGIR